MTRQSKRMKEVMTKIELGKQYSIQEAIKKLKESAKVKFKESFDVAINLGVDAKKSDQAVRGAVLLPHGTGKKIKVAVFAQGENAEKAKNAGADEVGFEDLAEKIKKMKGNELDYNVIIATPDAMRIVGQLGTVLGPRGLMPNPKVGTVAADVATAVKNAKSGQVRFRIDKNGIIHSSVGKIDFKEDALKENIEALITELKRVKPSTAKGIYLKKITVSTTMGPGVQVDLSSLDV